MKLRIPTQLIDVIQMDLQEWCKYVNSKLTNLISPVSLII